MEKLFRELEHNPNKREMVWVRRRLRDSYTHQTDPYRPPPEVLPKGLPCYELARLLRDEEQEYLPVCISGFSYCEGDVHRV